MIGAMIARRVNGRMEPVGTIDIHKKGFRFETEDGNLSKLLGSVQKKGVETMGGEGQVGEVMVDRVETVKITEDCVSPLTDLLLDRGYHWWEEE